MELIENEFAQIYHFFDLVWVKKVTAFSEEDFNIGTNYRLITLKTRFLVHKRTKIDTFSNK